MATKTPKPLKDEPAGLPANRLRQANDGDIHRGGSHVLYWMTSARRAAWSFGLDRAIAWARLLGKPLRVLEPLRCDYPWASDRLHAFVIDGMRDQRAAFARSPIDYYPYLEPSPGAGKGLLEAFATEACVVIADDSPAFFLPRMLEAAATKVKVRLEVVDSNGLVPLASPGRAFPTAYAFRRWWQKHANDWLHHKPFAAPLKRLDLPSAASLPEDPRWPRADLEAPLDRLPLDHEIRPTATRGGASAAHTALTRFLDERLPRYAEARSHPDEDVASGLSPWLHFGHLSAHEVFWTLAERERFDPARLGRPHGTKEGFWQLSAGAEAFLDELITWRELGYGFAHHRADYADYEALPAWAKATLARHASDPRPVLYPLEVLEAAETADPLWNAAQRQLLRDGVIHNYLRMLWGKRVLEWSRSPQEALQRLVHLNNKYALDGRDPNSWSGIFWVFGRFDRPWGPERPIFGTVRYMSSANTAKKLRVKRYLKTYA